MLTAKMYEAVKSDIEYTQDKVLQYVKAKGRIIEYVQETGSITNAQVRELCRINNEVYCNDEFVTALLTQISWNVNFIKRRLKRNVCCDISPIENKLRLSVFKMSIKSSIEL